MKTLNLSQSTRNLLLFLVAIGVVFTVWAFVENADKAWHGYIMNYFFFMSIGIGGCFFAATQHLTSAGWSATVRRIPESFHAWFLPSVALFIPIMFGGMKIYEWTHKDEVAKDHLLQMKSAYLNLPFFGVRAAIFFVIWGVVGGALVRNSLKQDESGDVNITNKNKTLSAIFIPLFALSFSAMAVDLLMSLEPHWFSTIFGIVAFANMFLMTMAVAVIVTVGLKKAGYFGESVNENHIQNLGLLMFAFVVFHAYVAFCQFMLIWYANMPEETFFYAKRWDGGWKWIALLVLFVKFIVPFLILLPREAKRNMDRVRPMAYFLLVACWIDIYWLVMPAKYASPFFPIKEFGMFLGFAGLFGLSVAKFLSKHPVMPQKDPRVHEALHLHQ